VFVIFCVFAIQSLSSRESEEINEGITRFLINWDLYQYEVKSVMNMNEAISLNERFYVRNQIRELLLKRISSDIENLYIDNSHKISDILDENINFRREFPIYLQSINLVRMLFRNNVIEASTSLPLRGNQGLLSHLPLPWATMAYNSLSEPEYVGEAYQKTRVGNDFEAGLVPLQYSGIIIDLRGMEVNEALAPRIYSQTGQLIYGPEFIMQKIGVQRGIIAYVNSMDDPEAKIRAGSSAYFTVGLSTRGQYKTDVVVSSRDATRIMQHIKTLESLQKCRVIFLVDKKNV